MKNETRVEESAMASSDNDEWKQLCEAITREPDSKRLMDLVKKLNETLEKREQAKRQQQQQRLSSGGM
jgi:hypothetical protein